MNRQKNMAKSKKADGANDHATLALRTDQPDNGGQSSSMNECTPVSTISPGTDAGPAVSIPSTTVVAGAKNETEKLSLLDLFKSKDVTIRARNTRVVLKRFQIDIRPFDLGSLPAHAPEPGRSRNENVRKRTRRSGSSESETEAITADTDTSSDDDSSSESLTSEDETFVKSEDSDYSPSPSCSRRRARVVRTRSKQRQEETKRRKLRSHKRSVPRRKNPRRIVSSSDDDEENDIPASSKSSPMKTRAQLRRSLPKNLSRTGDDRKGNSRRVTLRKKQIIRNLYEEEEQSSGKDDPDFRIDSPEKTPTNTKIPTQIPHTPSPPLVALEEIPESVPPKTPEECAWQEGEEFIQDVNTGNGRDGHDTTATPLGPGSDAVILGIPEGVPPLSGTQSTPGVSGASARAPCVNTSEPETIPMGATPVLASLLRNDQPQGEEYTERRAYSSDTESVVSLSELYSTLVPVPDTGTEPIDDVEEDCPPEIIGGVQGKICPYCSKWVPCFKLEMHGSLLHGRKDLGPFLYVCRFCEPQEPFQTLITLIDHIEVRHNQNLSIPRNSIPASSHLQQHGREPGFLGMSNVNLLGLRNHLTGIIAQNSQNCLSCPPQTQNVQTITYFPPGSNPPPAPNPGDQVSSSLHLAQTLPAAQVLFAQICKSQIITSLEFCNFPRYQVTQEMGIAIRNSTKEALKRMFLPIHQHVIDNPEIIHGYVASMKKQVHDIVLQCVWAQIGRNRTIPPNGSPAVAASTSEAGINSAHCTSPNSPPTSVSSTSPVPTGVGFLQRSTLTLTAPAAGSCSTQTGISSSQPSSPPRTAGVSCGLGQERIVSAQRWAPASTAVALTAHGLGSAGIGFPQRSDPTSVAVIKGQETSELPTATPQTESEDDDFECFNCQGCNMDFQTEEEACEHLRIRHGHNLIQRVSSEVSN